MNWKASAVGLCLVASLLSSTALGQSTWAGGSPNWATAGAWNPAPTNGTLLRWDATSTNNRDSTNNIAGLSVTGLSFLNATGSYTLDGEKLTITTGSIANLATVTAVTIDMPIDFNSAAGGNLNLQGGNNALTINGVISAPGAAKSVQINSGTVTLTGSNTFGDMRVGTSASAAVKVSTLANSGVAQPLGTATINFGYSAGFTGTVIYTGSALASTNNRFSIGRNNTNSGGGGFSNDGSGAVTWTGTQTLAGSATNTRTFTLGGTNPGDNTWQSVLANNSAQGPVGINKTGAGKWILSGANTYTGATTVSEGVLLIDGSTNASSAVTVNLGAIIGGEGTVNGNLTLSSGALFAFDTGSTLDLGGSFSLDSSFGVASLRSTSGGAVDWANIAQGTYTLMNTSFTFNDTNISNFGTANQATGVNAGRKVQRGAG